VWPQRVEVDQVLLVPGHRLGRRGRSNGDQDEGGHRQKPAHGMPRGGVTIACYSEFIAPTGPAASRNCQQITRGGIALTVPTAARILSFQTHRIRETLGMNMRRLNRYVVALVVFAVSSGLVRGDEAKTRAVIVGISAYRDAQIQSRTLAEADARAIAEIALDQRYVAAPAENVRLLVGPHATREKILAAADWLVNESGPGDIALFFFFGQGAGLDR